MERSSEPRKTVNLSESVHQRLNMYALAASAAGVGMLALASPSEAKIVYTQAHRVIGPNSIYKLDLNHDGITDFTFNNSGDCGTESCGFILSLLPANSNRAVGYVRYLQIPRESALKWGIRIGPGRHFQEGRGEMVDVGRFFYTYVSGPWANVKSRYLGLKFVIKDETHYGWARLNVKVLKTIITATLTGYAYETIPEKAIIAGQTKEPDDISIEEPDAALIMPSPEPAALGALALGAPGLSIWRRDESAVGGSN